MGFQPLGQYTGAIGEVTRESLFRKPVVFYDKVTFEWASNRIVIEDGTIKGFLSIQGSDIFSTNWDGAVPADLSGGIDGAASAGFYIDSSAGRMHLTEALYLGVASQHFAFDFDQYGAGVMAMVHTLGSPDNDAVLGHAVVFGGGSTFASQVSLKSAKWDNQDQAWLLLLSVNDDDGYGLLTSGDEELHVGKHPVTNRNGVHLSTRAFFDDGTALLPSITFGSDPNTGIYQKANDVLGLTSGGNLAMELDSAGRVSLHGTVNQLIIYSRDNDDQASLWYNASGNQMICWIGSARLQIDTSNATFYDNVIPAVTQDSGMSLGSGSRVWYAAYSRIFYANDGTKTVPTHSFTADTDTGIYRVGTNNLGFSCGNSQVWNADGTNIRWTNHIIVASSNTYNMGTSSVYINDINADNFFNRSDRRAKSNIRDITLGSKFIYGLRPRTFEKIDVGNWYDDDHTFDGYDHMGFIAQEVRDLLEEQGHPVDEMGLYRPPLRNDQEIDFENFPEQYAPGMHALSYEQFIAPLVATVQEQDKRLQDLENRLTNCPNCGTLDRPTTHGDTHAPIAT